MTRTGGIRVRSSGISGVANSNCAGAAAVSPGAFVRGEWQQDQHAKLSFFLVSSLIKVIYK